MIYHNNIRTPRITLKHKIFFLKISNLRETLETISRITIISIVVIYNVRRNSKNDNALSLLDRFRQLIKNVYRLTIRYYTSLMYHIIWYISINLLTYPIGRSVYITFHIFHKKYFIEFVNIYFCIYYQLLTRITIPIHIFIYVSTEILRVVRI
jgi:hypothetical protein